MAINSFKDIVCTLRKERNLSQIIFAKELGVGASTVAMWETGKRYPSVELYGQIADFFNVDVDYLYGRTSIRKKTHLHNAGTESVSALCDLTIEEMNLIDKYRLLEKGSKSIILGAINAAPELQSN